VKTKEKELEEGHDNRRYGYQPSTHNILEGLKGCSYSHYSGSNGIGKGGCDGKGCCIACYNEEIVDDEEYNQIYVRLSMGLWY